jgi:hypothetical protein
MIVPIDHLQKSVIHLAFFNGHMFLHTHTRRHIYTHTHTDTDTDTDTHTQFCISLRECWVRGHFFPSLLLNLFLQDSMQNYGPSVRYTTSPSLSLCLLCPGFCVLYRNCAIMIMLSNYLFFVNIGETQKQANLLTFSP